MATKKVQPETSVEEDKVTTAPKKAKNEDKPIIPKDVDLSTFITVKSGYNGRMIYVSSRTNERYEWARLGDEQEIELRELRNAKSSAKAFFINNWFMFDEEFEWVIPYLGMTKYYFNAIKPDEFDDLFEKPADEIREIVSKLTKGQQKTVGYIAREKVVNGDIDSRKTIATLEEVLNIQLIEH